MQIFPPTTEKTSNLWDFCTEIILTRQSSYGTRPFTPLNYGVKVLKRTTVDPPIISLALPSFLSFFSFPLAAAVSKPYLPTAPLDWSHYPLVKEPQELSLSWCHRSGASLLVGLATSALWPMLGLVLSQHLLVKRLLQSDTTLDGTKMVVFVGSATPWRLPQLDLVKYPIVRHVHPIPFPLLGRSVPSHRILESDQVGLWKRQEECIYSFCCCWTKRESESSSRLGPRSRLLWEEERPIEKLMLLSAIGFFEMSSSLSALNQSINQ